MCGSSKTPLRVLQGSACSKGFAPVMLLLCELLQRLFFCRVTSEFVFGRCCVCSFLPCLGKRLLRLHPGAQADSREPLLTPPSICIWIAEATSPLHSPPESAALGQDGMQGEKFRP